jgi:hypothetical protein
MPVLSTSIGTCALSPGFDTVITLESGQLFLQPTNHQELPPCPASPTNFFLQTMDTEIEFARDALGRMNRCVLAGWSANAGSQQMTLAF